MSSKQEIQKRDNLVRKIEGAWSNPQVRSEKWGNVLKAIHIEHIRGFTATKDIEFEWPISIIGGTNRSGKSTLLQICTFAYTNIAQGQNFEYNRGFWFDKLLDSETPALA